MAAHVSGNASHARNRGRRLAGPDSASGNAAHDKAHEHPAILLDLPLRAAGFEDDSARIFLGIHSGGRG